MNEKEKQKTLRLFYKPAEYFAIDIVLKMGGSNQVFHGNSTIVYVRKIGENFLVYPNITIRRDAPKYGDDIIIYTGVIIIGEFCIENNVKVGAGALVNKDVPDNCTVAGNPMKVI